MSFEQIWHDFRILVWKTNAHLSRLMEFLESENVSVMRPFTSS